MEGGKPTGAKEIGIAANQLVREGLIPWAGDRPAASGERRLGLQQQHGLLAAGEAGYVASGRGQSHAEPVPGDVSESAQWWG